MKNKGMTIKIIKLVLSAIAMVTTLTYFLGISFGWFYSNYDVTGGGMGTQFTQSEVNIIKVEATGVGVVDGNTLNVKMVDAEPSDSTLITITFELLENVKQLNFVFEAPSGCETPVIEDDGKGGKIYHYFGTEIDITKIAFDGTNIADGTVLNKPLFNENGAVWENKSPVTPMDKEIYNVSNVSRGVHIFSVELTFRNDLTHSQNALKNFGEKPGQVSYRRIAINTL